MADDTTSRRTDGSGEKGAFDMLLGAAAWGALTWLEKHDKRKRAADETLNAPPPAADADVAAVTPPPVTESARPSTPPANPESRLRIDRQVATVMRNEQTVPYHVPINQGGMTVYYNAGTLNATVTYTAVVAGRGAATTRIIAGPATDIEDVRAELRASGWQRVPGGTPERWANSRPLSGAE